MRLPKLKISKRQKILLVLPMIVIIGLVASAWFIGGMLYSPAHQKLGTPNIPYPYQDVILKSKSGSDIKGWMYPVDKKAPAVALFHGVRSNRKSMLSRAEFLIQAGFNVLLIDLQAHGESSGEFISFGIIESWDVKAAIAYLRKRYPRNRIGAIGASLGAAACLLGDKPVEVDALVLEAVYPNIGDAVKNRLEIKLGKIGRVLSPLLTMQFKPRLGISTDSLRPEQAIKGFRGALLMIAGSNDRHTPIDESQRIYRNAHEPKTLWVVKGAAHVDYLKYSGAVYQSRILEFFRQYLVREK